MGDTPSPDNGGTLVQLLFSGAIPHADTLRGEFGVLGVFDTEVGEIIHLTEYTPPASLRCGQFYQFTGFEFAGNLLYACSFNEILVFDEWPPQRPVERISHRQFNDLHHCIPGDGGVWVANTGLETVDFVSFDGSLKERFDLLANDSDPRHIDPRVDYRMIRDTKPHVRHVNHLLFADETLWATQLRTCDAISLGTPQPQRIFLDVGMPHDGRWIGDRAFFTTTNGHLASVDPAQPSRIQYWNLADMSSGLQQLGWCRGVCAHPDEPDQVFVGFSKIRRSTWLEVGYWIKHQHATPQGRIALYDLAEKRMVESWNLGPDPGFIVFQIDVLDADRRL
jgi:hypothetical protein